MQHGSRGRPMPASLRLTQPLAPSQTLQLASPMLAIATLSVPSPPLQVQPSTPRCNPLSHRCSHHGLRLDHHGKASPTLTLRLDHHGNASSDAQPGIHRLDEGSARQQSYMGTARPRTVLTRDRGIFSKKARFRIPVQRRGTVTIGVMGLHLVSWGGGTVTIGVMGFGIYADLRRTRKRTTQSFAMAYHALALRGLSRGSGSD